MFGQERCTQALAFESAKYIHSFIVQLGGTPTVNTTISWDKVGSRYQVTVNLTTTDSNGHTSEMDSTIRAQIAAGLTITSTNRNALDIPEDPVLNADGSITFYIEAGDGTAELNLGSENYSGILKSTQGERSLSAAGSEATEAPTSLVLSRLMTAHSSHLSR